MLFQFDPVFKRHFKSLKLFFASLSQSRTEQFPRRAGRAGEHRQKKIFSVFQRYLQADESKGKDRHLQP
jgi:hypothetical protein